MSYADLVTLRSLLNDGVRSLRFNITNPAANIFAADVPNNQTRKILKIAMKNNNLATPTDADFLIVRRDDTTRSWELNVPVAAGGMSFVAGQQEADVLKPILPLQGAQNIQTVRGGSIDIEGTIYWIDEPIV